MVRNLLSREALPQLPSRLVLSLGIIVIVLVPLIAIEVDRFEPFRLLAPVLVLLFAVLEWVEHRFYPDRVPEKIGTVFLLTRIVLAQSTTYLNESPLNMLLLTLVIFDAYFVFGSRVTALLVVVYVLISIVRFDQLSLVFNESKPIVGWLINNLVLVFLLIFARALQRDKEHQRYTEQLLTDLQKSHRELRAYASQIADLVAIEERIRLARDIHDSIGHYLTGVNIQLERARVFHSRDPQQSLLAIQEAKQAAQEALQDVRHSVAGLRETDSSFSLHHSLDKLLNNLASDSLLVEFQFSGNENGYNHMTLLTLYRAVQEGLTNIQKHANATLIKLDVELDDYRALLRLSDNGQGFDRNLQLPLADEETGFGLQGISERIELIRGKMTLTSTPEQGTTLLITVPKNF